MDKLFIVDYYFKNVSYQNIKTYMVKESSRGQAERRCREMESPEIIAIKKIKSCDMMDSDKHNDDRDLSKT